MEVVMVCVISIEVAYVEIEEVGEIPFPSRVS